jgi:hypothetical protein
MGLTISIELAIITYSFLSRQRWIGVIDIEMLKAQVYFGLKNNSLSAENWEAVICESMGATWIEGDKYLADGILGRYILNIKTLKMNPDILKTKENRDFLSYPQRFDPENQMMIQRRTNLPVTIDEQQNTPAEIGAATLRGFEDFVAESYTKFSGTDKVLDVIVRHGVDRSEKRYLVDIDIFEHTFHNPADLEWTEVVGGGRSRQRGKRVAVEGYLNGKLVARRNGSNSGLYQTNYLIYKDLTKSENNYTINIPLPAPLKFNKDQLLVEMHQLEVA